MQVDIRGVLLPFFSGLNYSWSVSFRSLGMLRPAAWRRSSPTCCSSPPRSRGSWWLRSDEEPPINQQVSPLAGRCRKNIIGRTCKHLFIISLASLWVFPKTVFLLVTKMIYLFPPLQVFVLPLDLLLPLWSIWVVLIVKTMMQRLFLVKFFAVKLQQIYPVRK